jgi:hypothetical protein
LRAGLCVADREALADRQCGELINSMRWRSIWVSARFAGPGCGHITPPSDGLYAPGVLGRPRDRADQLGTLVEVRPAPVAPWQGGRDLATMHYLPIRTRGDRHSVGVEWDRPERRTYSSRAHLACVTGGGAIGDSPRRNIRSVNLVSLSRSLAYRRLLSMAREADVIRAGFPIGG